MLALYTVYFVYTLNHAYDNDYGGVGQSTLPNIYNYRRSNSQS